MRRKYGRKVYKLPVRLPVSCPNRMAPHMTEAPDSSVPSAFSGAEDRSHLSDFPGCTFCGASGAGFENLPAEFSVREQLGHNIDYIGNRYGADLFVAYFQNFTNTFLPLEDFSSYLEEALSMPQIVEACVSTRPDCVSDRYLETAAEVCRKCGKQTVFELGLQSINYKTLEKIRRGHSLAEFIDAVLRCRRHGFEVCAHLILNLPWDDDSDAVEAAKILTALGVSQVKLHSLYIERETEMCRQYENGEFQLIGAEEYAARAVKFLEYLSPDICVQRLVSRAPEQETVFCNWGMSWWKVRDMIDRIMEENDLCQGDKCDYLGRDYYFWKKRREGERFCDGGVGKSVNSYLLKEWRRTEKLVKACPKNAEKAEKDLT